MSLFAFAFVGVLAFSGWSIYKFYSATEGTVYERAKAAIWQGAAAAGAAVVAFFSA
jgi:hypothetical protein